jgi:hypothetical protein
LTPPEGFVASVASPTVATVGSAIFTAHNRYAAISSDNGNSFSYIDPAETFPATGDFEGGFCCNQLASQDRMRDLVFWLLEYFPIPDSPYTNGLRLAVAHGDAGLVANAWQYHDILPGDFGFTRLTSPQLQVGANYLYFTATTFDEALGQFRGVSDASRSMRSTPTRPTRSTRM